MRTLPEGLAVNLSFQPVYLVIYGKNHFRPAPGEKTEQMKNIRSAFADGDHKNFEIKHFFGVEASVLHPDVKYSTVAAYLIMFRRIKLSSRPLSYLIQQV